MELLLNLAWLLLALPAYWLWRDCRTVRSRRRSSLQCLFSLGCLLILLFPVISATDDLRAMRAEMEESPTSKRSVGQKNCEKSSSSNAPAQPLLPVASLTFQSQDAAWRLVSASSLSVPPTPTIKPSGRAPPSLLS
jgi:hypothetical protein